VGFIQRKCIVFIHKIACKKLSALLDLNGINFKDRIWTSQEGRGCEFKSKIKLHMSIHHN
jgi:hypothetical protein